MIIKERKFPYLVPEKKKMLTAIRKLQDWLFASLLLNALKCVKTQELFRPPN